MRSNSNCSVTIKRVSLIIVLLGLGTILVLGAYSKNESSPVTSPGQQSSTDWKLVEQALGKAGSLQPGDVYKVSLPRSDLKASTALLALTM